jgi:hypothetical protein
MTAPRAVRTWQREFESGASAHLSAYEDGQISLAVYAHGMHLGLVLDRADAEAFARGILGDQPVISAPGAA